MDNESEKTDNSFGRDFLTYLCYKSDAKAGLFNVAEPAQQYSLWIDGKIVMEDDSNVPPNTVSYSGDDFNNQDLKQAIRSGKKVREARIRIEKSENTWSFILRADRLEVSGLKIDMPRTNDNDERFSGRILCIEALNLLIDDLYEYFLKEVSGKNWQTNGYREFHNWLNKS
jgi:recombination associated protein RdgC